MSRPDLRVVTEDCHEGRTALMTARITVGESGQGGDIQVYVTDAYDNDDPAEVVIALDDDSGDDTKWGVLTITDPAVVRRLADTLPAAALVLEQLQNGELP